MVVRDIFGVLTAVLILAGISVAIINSTGTASIISTSGNAFASLVKQASHPGPY